MLQFLINDVQWKNIALQNSRLQKHEKITRKLI